MIKIITVPLLIILMWKLDVLYPVYYDVVVEPVLTVEDGVEKLGFGFFQVLISVFCGLLYVRQCNSGRA